MSTKPVRVFDDPLLKPDLDERLYSLSGDGLEFFKSETGIEEELALKQHIFAIQKEAYAIYGYPCIRSFAFTKLRISRVPAYQTVLKIGRERENAILLDIGCCFGNDIRKAVADGWPVQNVIASDLRHGFWDFGHLLFKSTPETFPVAFVAGDVFDPALIAPRVPFYEGPETPRPVLVSLTSLTPLQGHVSAIYAASFFHLFDEAKQLEVGRRIASLLSPIPGSVIFGSHGGLPEKGMRYEEGRNNIPVKMFCHSPESWTELWEGQIFDKGSVRVDAGLKKVDRPDLSTNKSADYFLLWWSVTIL